jgi:hypothetical protein
MKVGVYLQQYLTYNLQVTYLDSETDTNVIKIGIMYGITLKFIDKHEIMMVSISSSNHSVMVSKVKPILKPLNDFTSEMQKEVEEFIGLGNWCDAYDEYFDIWFADAQMPKSLALQCPYTILQYFLAHHYDVFGLIDAGLAISSNNLKIK